jgi:hypothetical protein
MMAFMVPPEKKKNKSVPCDLTHDGVCMSKPIEFYLATL